MTPHVQISRLLTLAASGSPGDIVVIPMADGMAYRDLSMWYVGRLKVAGAVTLQPVLIPADTVNAINSGAATSLVPASALAAKIFQQVVGECAPATSGLKKHPDDAGVPTILRYGLKVTNTGANEEQLTVHLVAVAAPVGG